MKCGWYEPSVSPTQELETSSGEELKPMVPYFPDEQVKRYGLEVEVTTVGVMVEARITEQENGPYVLFSDYQSLSAELERVKQFRNECERQYQEKQRELELSIARAEAAELSNTALRGALEKAKENALVQCRVAVQPIAQDYWRGAFNELSKVIAALAQVEGDTK